MVCPWACVIVVISVCAFVVEGSPGFKNLGDLGFQRGEMKAVQLNSFVELKDDDYAMLNTRAFKARGSMAGPFASTTSPVVVPALNLAFCAAAKVGSSKFRPLWDKRVKTETRWPISIEAVMGHAHIQQCCRNNQPCCTKHARHMELQLRDLLLENATRVINDNGWVKAAFVRDPAVRMLSGWINKFRSQQDGPTSLNLYRENLGLPKDYNLSTISFEQFVDMVAAQDPVDMNIHWNPQSLNCNLGKYIEAYHFIGCFENVAEEYEAMADGVVDHALKKIANHPERESIEANTRKLLKGVFMENTAHHKTNAASEMGAYFSPVVLTKIQEIYKEDYALFGEYCGWNVASSQ